MATLGEAFVKILPDTSQFGKDATKGIEDGLKKTEKTVEQSSKRMSSDLAEVGKTVAAAFVTQQIVGFAKASIQAAEAAQVSRNRIEQIAQTVGVFGSQVSQVTDRLVKYAEATARQTGIDDDQIQAAQAKLLTFKNLAVTADEVGGAFDRVTMAAIDMSAAGFGDAAGNAVKLARALEDPTKGMNLLARSGVIFTAEQKNVIRSLVETNEVGKAQAIILQAIEDRFKGTAEATATGSAKMRVAYEELQEEIGNALLPAFQSLTSVITPLLSSFNALPTEVRNLISTVGISTAVTAGFSRTLQGLGVAAGVAKGAMGVLNVAMIAFTLYSQQNANNASAWQKSMQNLTAATNDQIRAQLEYMKTMGDLALDKNPAEVFEEIAQSALGTAQRILDLGLAQDVLGLSTQEATAIIDKQIAAQNQQQADMERGALLTGQAAGAVDEFANAQDGAADATSALNDELSEQEERMKKAMDAAISSFSTEIRVEQAKRATNDAISEYNALSESMTNGTYRGEDAFRDLAEASEGAKSSALDQAAAVAQLAFEQAVAAGAAENSIDKNQLFKGALEQLAGTLAPGSPLRKELEAYIRTLGNIERNIVTTVTTVFTQTGQQYAVSPYGAMPVRKTTTNVVRDPRARADGGIITRPEIALIGEAGPEVIIPLSRTARAMELMRQSGLDSMVGSRAATVNIETAVFNNGTDANLVAQKVNAAERARSFST